MTGGQIQATLVAAKETYQCELTAGFVPRGHLGDLEGEKREPFSKFRKTRVEFLKIRSEARRNRLLTPTITMARHLLNV
jgi:hypothetical protein